MNNTKVTTINGHEILKSNSRKIKQLNGEYGFYKIGNINQKDSGDCYQINGIYYTIDKGRITWDYYKKEYVLKSRTVEGIIDNNGNIGNFTPSTENVIVHINNTLQYTCINESKAINNGYVKGNDNNFYNIDYFGYSKVFPRKIIDDQFKKSLSYNAKNYIEEAIIKFENVIFSKNSYVNDFYKTHKRLFDSYSFGIEIETTKGMIPESIYNELGLFPVRDGSIAGLEYVTIPLTSEKGLYAFIEILKNIKCYTDSDYTCSMHIHIGNIPRTEEFIVAMYKFMYYFQDNIYSLFPSYKEKNDGIKRQCYTAPLNSFVMNSLNFKCDNREDVKSDYSKIVRELSGKHSDFDSYVPLESINFHPQDPSESSKWQMKQRYSNLNIIPLIFTNKETIEYRIFTVPDTIEKGLFFLLTALISTDYVVNNTNEILGHPNHLKNVSFERLSSHVTQSNLYKYMYLDRLKLVNNLKLYKGAFFEEKDVKSSNYFLPNKF